MNTERVRADRGGEGVHLIGRHLAGLNDTEIAQNQGARRDVSYAIGRGGPRAQEHGALAPEAEGEPSLFCETREFAVDASRLFRAAGHRRDQEGRTQFLAEDSARSIDDCLIQVW
jgi:hypothetical protein